MGLCLCVRVSVLQGAIVGSVNRRKGVILNSEQQADDVVLFAEVPLNNMFGYSTELRSMTQGKGEFTMEYERHAAVTQDALVRRRRPPCPPPPAAMLLRCAPTSPALAAALPAWLRRPPNCHCDPGGHRLSSPDLGCFPSPALSSGGADEAVREGRCAVEDWEVIDRGRLDDFPVMRQRI